MSGKRSTSARGHSRGGRDCEPWLAPAQLYRACDPRGLGFATTAEIEPLSSHIGQDDALAALEFGVGVSREGYNVFVLGRPGSGRTTNLRRVLARHAASQPTPPDRCYVFDFSDPRRPDVLTLRAGRGATLRTDMLELIADIRQTLPEALEGEDVSRRRASLVEDHMRQAREALDAYRSELEADPWVALVGGEEGFTVMPARGGEALSVPAFEALPEELHRKVDAHLLRAREKLVGLQREIHRLHREAHALVADLHRRGHRRRCLSPCERAP